MQYITRKLLAYGFSNFLIDLGSSLGKENEISFIYNINYQLL